MERVRAIVDEVRNAKHSDNLAPVIAWACDRILDKLVADERTLTERKG
jgi:hypothetical protein